jgi:GGDEF domain-containing protein
MRALDRLEHIGIAIATRFAERALHEGRLVRGTRYPYFETPMVSASAHLAGALWTLGIDSELIPSLLTFVRDQQRTDGGWGDEQQPSDLPTTLAAADLLTHLDPSFTLEPGPAVSPREPGRAAARSAVRFIARQQEAAGWWRALDPETPWLTVESCRWLRAIEQPFPMRFRWPRPPRWLRDRKTSVPLFAFFEDLSNAAAEIGGLGDAASEVAFLDLIGFGDWNKVNGQERGDQLLKVLADELGTISNSLVVRDGGDEFLVVGKPGLAGVLQGATEAFMVRWWKRCNDEFSDCDHVYARAVVTHGKMRDALAIRERLGKAVGEIKGLAPEVPWGVMAVLDGSERRVVHGLAK